MTEPTYLPPLQVAGVGGYSREAEPVFDTTGAGTFSVHLTAAGAACQSADRIVCAGKQGSSVARARPGARHWRREDDEPGSNHLVGGRGRPAVTAGDRTLVLASWCSYTQAQGKLTSAASQHRAYD